MVPITLVRQSNAQLNQSNAPRVSVFVGGTSGVGKLTVDGLVRSGVSMKVYIVGRPSSEALHTAFPRRVAQGESQGRPPMDRR